MLALKTGVGNYLMIGCRSERMYTSLPADLTAEEAALAAKLQKKTKCTPSQTTFTFDPSYDSDLDDSD